VKDMNYTFGVDIGGTTIKIGLFDNEYNLLDKYDITTVRNIDGSQIVIDTVNKIKEIMEDKKFSYDQLSGIGIAVPGPVKNNFIISTANINWNNFNVRESFEELFDEPVRIVSANDANSAALGEHIMMNSNSSNTVLITLGTGIGGGIIINNKILEGQTGVGGEIGHVPLDEFYNFECGCGRVGCSETVGSARGINLLVKYHLSEADGSVITTRSSAQQIFDAAKSGDEFALKIVDIYSKYLAKLSNTISVIINPETIIFGGGISKAGDFLINTNSRTLFK